MSDTPELRPTHEPATEDLPAAPEQQQPRPVESAESDAVKGGAFPDYAKVPSPYGPIPVPYPNL